MQYMTDTIWNKRLPSIVSIFFLAIAIVTIGWTSKNAVYLGSNAEGGDIPHNIRITNNKDSEFTVSYITTADVFGTVSYGTTPQLGTIALDKKDQSSGTSTTHRIHYIIVRGLTPETKYFFTIISGGNVFLINNVAFTTTTGTKLIGNGSYAKQITGSVKTSDGTSAQEGIAYLTIAGLQTLSTEITSAGSYTFSLDNTRTQQLDTYGTPSDGTTTVLELETASEHSNILFLPANPLPAITLSKNYDFTAQIPSPIISPAPSSSTSGFPVFNSSFSANSSLQLTTPQDATRLQDQQPVFKGTALPNSTVQVTVHSAELIQTSIQSDGNGHWSFRPTTPLSPGQHTVTVINSDSGQSITRSFTILTLGSQFTAPSVSPSQNDTPTPTIIPTATITPSPVPTTALSSTPAPKLNNSQPTTKPTNIPSPTVTISPTKTPIVVPPAFPIYALFDIGMIIGLVIITIGTMFFFATRKTTSV